MEEALRRAAVGAEVDREARAAAQRGYLERLGSRADVAVLASDEMWR